MGDVESFLAVINHFYLWCGFFYFKLELAFKKKKTSHTFLENTKTVNVHPHANKVEN